MRRATIFMLVLVLAACHRERPPEPNTSVSDDQKRTEIKAPPLVTSIGQLAGPESALYDPQQDVYFISNMNGGLLERDGNGFITRVDAATLKTTRQWATGLDAPKGMAIVGDSLYVSDITGVRKFDRRSGAAQGIIPLPGTTLINDLTTDGTNVYASDTGVTPGAGEAFNATGTDSIWKISNDRAQKIAAGRDLKQPNGLVWADGKLWAVTFSGGGLYSVEAGRRGSVTALPREELDGVVYLADGTFLVSSWYGAAVYRGKPGGKFEPILQSLQNPADIGYDTKRHLLLVPETPLNHVALYHVQ